MKTVYVTVKLTVTDDTNVYDMIEDMGYQFTHRDIYENEKIIDTEVTEFRSSLLMERYDD